MQKKDVFLLCSVILNIIFIIFFAVLLVNNTIVWFFDSADFSGTNNTQAELKPEVFGEKSTENTRVKVKRIIDGDTIEMENGIKVRYIGIDTPESNSKDCFASESAGKNAELVLGKEVRLEKDVSETDRYGRLLRYVYVDKSDSLEGEIFVNEVLVKDGFAHALTYPPDIAFAERFVAAEKGARQENRGLWGKCK